MSNTLQTLLGCGGSIFIVLLAIAYIITSAGRKKSECPNCTKKVAPKQAFYDYPQTGQRTLGESDFAFALVASIGNILIGLAAVGFPLYLVLGALGDESCAVEGIIIRCVSYTSTMKVETTLNLGWELLSMFENAELKRIDVKLIEKYMPKFRKGEPKEDKKKQDRSIEDTDTKEELHEQKQQNSESLGEKSKSTT